MSSDKVIPNLTKLTQLNAEIKRISLHLKNLRHQKEETESDITKYLEEVNQPGIQYKNLIVLNKQYKQQKSKNKEDRNKSMMEVLENNGIRNSQDVLKQLIECSKDTIDKNKLHVKEIEFKLI
jgi:lipopolysaccharide biosynthesis regulator YciM